MICIEIKLKAALSVAGKRLHMKMELKIEGKLFAIEAEGAITLQIREEVPGPAVPSPVPVVVRVPVEEAVRGPVPAEGDDLFAKLAELRHDLAVAEKVPPYIVFQDRVLREMARVRPADMAAFGAISGVGKAKLEKYGEMFLAVIQGAA